MEYFLEFILDLVYPKFCFGCGRIDSYFCAGCVKSIPINKNQRCIVCQKPSLDGFTHPKCKGSYSPDRLTSLYEYRTGPIAELILSGKHEFIPEIYAMLGRLLAASIHPLPASTAIPLPLSKRKLLWRGFNQSEILADEISRAHGVVISKSLHRTRNTKAQKELSKEGRKENMKGAFLWDGPETAPEIALLVDDVCTTGSTFIEATKALKQAGAGFVWCICIAQD